LKWNDEQHIVHITLLTRVFINLSGIAYNNCINGNSGLNDWMKKQNNKGLPTPMLGK
jgi:hypothetical protein